MSAYLALSVFDDRNRGHLQFMENDDDDKPPPCPWCGKPEVHELGASDADVRSFNCRSCSRSFVVSINPLNPAAPKRES